MAKSKIDIIYDMVNLAYDVKRQWSKDKDSIWLGEYARAVIKAKDEKVYDKFVDLANQLETEGWDEFINACKYLIDEYNQIEESKKSMKESINGDCYIYFDDNGEIYGKKRRWVFCDNVKGITGTRDFFPLNDFIIDAIHIFKNEKQAQKFIDEHLKYFADQDKVVIAEYPQTVSGFFESKKSARKSIEESKEINLIDNVANKLRKITDAYVDTYRGADWISLGKDEYTIKIIYMRNELSIELYKDGDFKDGELEHASSLSDDDFSVNYIIDFIKNFIKNRNYLKNKISIKESKESARKPIKESADDNWYKLKMLNEMLDAMEEDEYNIPKLGIYGVTKNIDLDEGAIEALIKYYK